MKLIGFALAIVINVPSIAAGQHEQHGASNDKLGTVSFETSCLPATRPDFSRAMALLHSFEFGPAVDSFNKVLGTDPNCAIAYWGVALTFWGNPFAGQRSPQVIANGKAAIVDLASLAKRTG